jgi:hypothetical protein
VLARRSLATVLAVVAGWVSRTTRAAEDPDERRVVLTIADCPAGAEAAIRRIVGLEIGDLLAVAGETGETDRLAVICTEELARLQAGGPGRPQQVDRTLWLNDFPADAVPRALALAGIEVLAALSPAVRRRVEAGTAKQETPVRAPVVQPATPPAWRADASGVWHRFLGDNGLSLWGGQARIAHDVGTHFSLSLDAEAASGSRAVALGQVSGFLGSSGVFLGAHAGSRDLFGELALGGRIGIAHLAGDPNATNVAGDRVSRAWGGPALSLRFWAGHGRLALVLCGESGLALLGAEGLVGDATAVSVRNLWVSLGLGLGIRL